MPFKKGQSGNPKGMPKGIKNKTTQEMKVILNNVMANQLDNVHQALEDIRENDPARYIDALSKLIGYVMPKKSDITTDGEKINITWHETKEYIPDENSDIA